MNRLERYRTEKGLTFEMLAKAVGLSKPGVFRHCRGLQAISGESALLYHIHLGIPLKDLRPDLYSDKAA
ncbi:helix-turn-helix transcriptional regulator [Maridesulfovibrio ferrireducens]|uniref:helix-turn-helix domain-containing protein n=1 Tax=Maridesulfovibrio ferrireducens TaxID=246191 RepID=UPI001A1D8441|nr:helix-turn-helix transcriptional regulator [Maridesulfovibrio ferrireducens]MBI9113261.1 helix-turn-helix transcriptional regulator [Maridesulfovibrio ferrireducens]